MSKNRNPKKPSRNQKLQANTAQRSATIREQQSLEARKTFYYLEWASMENTPLRRTLEDKSVITLEEFTSVKEAFPKVNHPNFEEWVSDEFVGLYAASRREEAVTGIFCNELSVSFLVREFPNRFQKAFDDMLKVKAVRSIPVKDSKIIVCVSSFNSEIERLEATQEAERIGREAIDEALAISKTVFTFA